MSKAVSITRHIDEGLPKPEDFSIIDVPAPDLGDATDKVVVELVYVSVDPYLRGRWTVKVQPHMGNEARCRPFALVQSSYC